MGYISRIGLDFLLVVTRCIFFVWPIGRDGGLDLLSSGDQLGSRCKGK